MGGGRETSARHSYATILLRSLPKIHFFFFLLERVSVPNRYDYYDKGHIGGGETCFAQACHDSYL